MTRFLTLVICLSLLFWTRPSAACVEGDIDCYIVEWANAEQEKEYWRSKSEAQSKELSIAYARIKEEQKARERVEKEPSYRAPLYFIAGGIVGAAFAIIWKEAKDK